MDDEKKLTAEAQKNFTPPPRNARKWGKHGILGCTRDLIVHLRWDN